MTVNNAPVMPDADEWLMTAGKAPESVEWGSTAPVNIQGRVVSKPHTYQAKEYNPGNPGAGKLKFRDDGTPLYGVWVDLDMGNGVRRLYVEKPRMTSAIRDALVRAGVRTLAPGGFLSLTWTGSEQGAGAMPAKTYSATYLPPDVADNPLTPPAPAAPAPAVTGNAPVELPPDVAAAMKNLGVDVSTLGRSS